MMNLLIFGSSGMAGHMVTKYLLSLRKYNIINIAYPKNFDNNSILMNIDNKNLVEEIIKKNRPDIIINCIGVLIKFSEANPDKAIYINSFFPHQLEVLGKVFNYKLIHISTDCVFSGSKGSYNENDLKDGIGFYAQSKALGEIVNDKDLTLRTSIIGPEIKENGEGLFHWFMMQKGEVNGYKNSFWTGVSTLELARNIEKAIIKNVSGIYHLVPDKKISKYELLRILKKIWGKSDIVLNEYDNNLIDKSLIDTRKILKVKSYEEMFKDLYIWMLINKNLYLHYKL